MESTSTSKFRFRDHQDMDDSAQSDTSSELSSVSSCVGGGDDDDETELRSMTAKGIKHLCSELLEIKAASDEDFHKNIFANYSAFHRIFEELEGMENELLKLKSQLSTQKRLVKDLDSIYLHVLSEDAIEPVNEESDGSEQSPLGELEAHINDLSENLDILIAENRIDEAIAILEKEGERYEKLQSDYNFSMDSLASYDCTISETKAILMLQLTLVAENPRITAAELQKALVGLCRLGDSCLATQLLVKYYHSRIASGVFDLKHSKSFLHGAYIRELSKFVFSMISQAAGSFVMLYGETSAYASEFIQWAHEELEVFVTAFNRYLKSISEISDGLSTAVEAAQSALSLCSLLENQRLVLRPCLIKYIRPSMEEALQIHTDHYKKVIGLFTATDSWVLGRYLVSGVLNEGSSSMVLGQQPEYCLLTNSGRKFVMVLQAITKDVTPLVALHMEGSILKGLVSLFTEYMVILERGVTSETTVIERSDSRAKFSEVLPQQVSVLANLSTIEAFFSGIVQSFGGGNRGNSELTKNQPFGIQQGELDSCILFIRKVASRLRAHFFQQFISRIMSVENNSWLLPETCVDNQNDNLFCGVMPSAAFQVLFLELRKLDKVAEDTLFDVDWLMELLRQLIKAIFVWISNNTNIWETTEENGTVKLSDGYNQFILDVNFLVEIAKRGGYFSSDPMVLTNLFGSAFISAGLDPTRDIDDDVRAKKAATDAILKLLEIESTKLQLHDESATNFAEDLHENQSNDGSNESVRDDGKSSLGDCSLSKDQKMAIDASAVTSKTEAVMLTTELSPPRQSVKIPEEEDSSANRTAFITANISGELEDGESDKLQFIKDTVSPRSLSLEGNDEEACERMVYIEGASSEPAAAELMTNNLAGDYAEEMPSETEVTITEYSVKCCDEDEKSYSTEMTAFVLTRDNGNDVEQAQGMERVVSRESGGANEGHG